MSNEPRTTRTWRVEVDVDMPPDWAAPTVCDDVKDVLRAGQIPTRIVSARPIAGPEDEQDMLDKETLP